MQATKRVAPSTVPSDGGPKESASGAFRVRVRCLACQTAVEPLSSSADGAASAGTPATGGKAGSSRFAFCGCDNRACIAMLDAATLSVFVGAEDVDRAQVELCSSSNDGKSEAAALSEGVAVRIPLRRWNALQARFKQSGSVSAPVSEPLSVSD